MMMCVEQLYREKFDIEEKLRPMENIFNNNPQLQCFKQHGSQFDRMKCLDTFTKANPHPCNELTWFMMNQHEEKMKKRLGTAEYEMSNYDELKYFTQNTDYDEVKYFVQRHHKLSKRLQDIDIEIASRYVPVFRINSQVIDSEEEEATDNNDEEESVIEEVSQLRLDVLSFMLYLTSVSSHFTFPTGRTAGC